MANSTLAVLAGLGALYLLTRPREEASPQVAPALAPAPAPAAPAAPEAPQPAQLPPVLPVVAPSTPQPLPTAPAPTAAVPQAVVVDLDLARIFAGLTAARVLITGVQADEVLYGPQIAMAPGDRLRAIIKIRNIGQALGRFRVRAALYLGDRKIADLYDVRVSQSVAETTLPAGSTGTLVMESLPLPFPGQPGQGQVPLDLLILVTTATDLGELAGKSYVLQEAVLFREVA